MLPGFGPLDMKAGLLNRPLTAYLDPRRYAGALRRLAYRHFVFDAEAIEREETAKLRAAGHDPALALDALNSTLSATRGRAFDFRSDSVHWLLFASHALAIPRPADILEIGTFDGTFTRMLALLFPHTRIVTVDLPDDDPLLRSLYGRGDGERFAKYREDQANNLRAPNIESLKINSFFLPDKVTGPFDLVWIDGGHLYPEVAWDFAHAWQLCRTGGRLLCDDVIPLARPYRDPYVSTESWEVIQYVAARAGCKPHLFLKRRDPDEHTRPHMRKYVASMTKPA